MNKFRASFSVLEQWSQGHYDRATTMYFKLVDFTNEYIEAGRNFHEDWEKEVSKTKAYPKVFGGKKIEGEFKTEYKIERQLDDWLELVGVIDLWQPKEKLIIDWKSGTVPSTQYSRGFQTKVYQVLLPEAKRAEIHHFNQYNHKTDMSIIHLTDKTLTEGLDWVLTFSSEMYAYLVDNKLYERFANESNLRQSL